MPQIPVYDRQLIQETPISPARMPLAAPNYFGDAGTGLLDLSTTLEKIQAGADIAEEGKIRQITTAKMTAAIKDAEMGVSDPTTFGLSANEALKTVHDNAIESASNDRVKARLRANLAHNLETGKTNIKIITHEKNIDKAGGDWIAQKEQAINNYNATDNPEEKAKITSDLQGTLAEFVRTDLMKYKAARAEIVDLGEKLSIVNAQQDWKKDPIGTLQKMDDGFYSKNISPAKLETLKTHLASSYRLAQADIKQKVADEQDNNFADAMVKARNSQITQGQIDRLASLDPATGKRAIDAQQAVQLSNQVKATMASGGVLYSDPKNLSDMQYRLHRGSLGAEEVRRTQLNGKLTIGDANELYTGIEGRVRRDRTEAREARTEARLNDIGNDPSYKRAESYITKALPNTDRLDTGHAFKIMVGQAFVDFDAAARATDAQGKPKYTAKDLQGVAENIVESTYAKMDLAKESAAAKLKPGIKTADDIAAAVRNKLLTPDEAREQMRWLMLSDPALTAPTRMTPAPATRPGASRNQSAQERGRALGAP